jgi:hypothetical protein
MKIIYYFFELFKNGLKSFDVTIVWIKVVLPVGFEPTTLCFHESETNSLSQHKLAVKLGSTNYFFDHIKLFF